MLTGILVAILTVGLIAALLFYSHKSEAKIDRELAQARAKEKK